MTPTQLAAPPTPPSAPAPESGAEPRRRTPQRDAVAAGVIAAVATALSTLAVNSMLSGTRWLLQALGAIGLVLVVGLALRAARVPRPAVIAAQLAACTAWVTAFYASGPAVAGFFPGPGGVERLRDRIDVGITGLNQATIPFTPGPDEALVALLGVIGTAIAVDALSASYRRPLLAGLPLLTLYAIPAFTLPEGPRTWLFVLPALGLLLLFVGDDRERLRRWGLLPDGADLAHAGARRTGMRIGLSVLAISLVVPAVIPKVTADLFDEQGFGQGKDPIETLDPLVEMRRHLIRTADIDLLQVTSDTQRPDEQYLRTVTLDEFTGTQWKAADRTLDKFDAALPPVAGLADRIPATVVQSTIHGLPEFRTDYLPMPYPATSVDVDGKWRVDPKTSNVLSTKGLEQVADRDYTVTSLDLDPSRNDVGDTVPGEDLKPYLELPKLPEKIRETAKRVTKGAEHPLNIGLKLQSWFHNPLYFTYDLRNDLGSGTDAILSFIKDGAGNCEQFAATMAVMARMLGVPARVNVGFTAGEDNGGIRTIRAHDAHAWPELFLPHIGWTRFEPTPGNASSLPAPPSWLRDAEASKEQGKGAEDDKPAKEKPAKEESEPPPPPPDIDLDGGSAPSAESIGAVGGVPPQAVGDPDQDSPSWLGILLWVLLALFLLFALLAIPAFIRAEQRRRRWALVAGKRAPPAGSPEAAATIAEVTWAELRDTALDLGYEWPVARTPRQTSTRLAEDAWLTERATNSLAAITTLVEQARYSAAGGPSTDAGQARRDVENVRDALALTAGREARVRAKVLPRSLRTSVFRPFRARVTAGVRGTFRRVVRRRPDESAGVT